ncbi:unnamed protein product [Triticum turgidum subsp. durum]|uniref:CCHC-type domain-containing protein n=1 Tax=Triticum turgidum subsp. durum TaxID=4567 RepID=A0A9R0TJP7_TRITD|nr:unnamed protein product [Triticum turgidum subsp. durum]
MVKARMTTADVAAEVKCLRRLIGMRLSNVYDITPKTYLFKLMNSSGITESGESEKVLLLMESGVRLHTTQYVRDKSTTPSGFTLKLRKHVRGKRLEDVRMLGYDRMILFQFGLGSNAHFIILELYAQGNIILTDSEYTVMTLLRSHRDDNKGLAIMSRHRYPVEACRTFERTDFTKLKDTLKLSNTVDDKESSQVTPSSADAQQPSECANDGVPATNKLEEPANRTGKKSAAKFKQSGSDAKASNGTQSNKATLKTLLGEALPYGPALAEHIILDAGLLPSTKVGKDPETFDDALDEFYSKIESQRVNQQHKAKEDSAVHRLNKIKLDQENRVHTLRKEADHCITMAELIEYNLEDVDAAIKAVRVSLANGMSWEALARMIKEEKKAGNPVAGLIDKLSFEKNCITLLLSNNLDDMDEEEKTAPVEKVEVDLSLSAHANARRWYEMKKKQETKQEKTITAHEKAFKAAEKKTRLQLAQEKTVAAITHMRKVHWFEKFNWFISSENYLIVSGRDAQQNELVVKRYMSKGDLYVHAELHGASSTIIKNHKPDSPIPPLTLNQAGCFTVCHSKAWDSKIVTSAWWVYPHQVSKTAPTGEYLTVGSFMIRGKKNFLPPHPLVMGFGILFRLDESCLASHLNERRIRGEDEALPETEAEPRLNERRIRGEDETLPETEAEPQKQQSNPESDDKLATDNEMSKGTHDNESSRDHTGVHQNDDTNHSNLPNVDTADKSQQVAETKAVENSGTDASVSSRLEDLLDKSLGLGPAKGSGKSSLLVSSLSSLGEDTDDLDVKKSMVREKPYVSKAERRKLKKGENACESSDPQKVVKKPDNPQQEKGKDNTKAANPKTSRGQKGKLKKIKEKYAEQDEEEREIRMALLASSGKASQKDNPSQDGEDTTAKQSKPSTGEDDSLKVCYKCKKSGHLSRDCPESTSAVDPTDVNVGRSRDGMDRSATPVDGSIAMDEDDINELGDEEKEKLIDLDYLTGIPVASDILLYAVPVCAPYNALQTYKYRVKITPGTAKKGKAAKTAMSLFMHIPDATNREKELMKACTDPELVAAIVGNAKITAPGLTQLKQKQKQKGKKAVKSN